MQAQIYAIVAILEHFHYPLISTPPQGTYFLPIDFPTLNISCAWTRVLGGLHDWLPSLAPRLQGSSMLKRGSVLRSFLWPNNMPLYGRHQLFI